MRGKHLACHGAANSPRTFSLRVHISVNVSESFSELWEQTWPLSCPSVLLYKPILNLSIYTYTHAHPFFLPQVQTTGKEDVSFSHTRTETSFPWSAVLSPPQGSGCCLVHSRMGMTWRLRDPPLNASAPTTLPHRSTGIPRSLSSLTPAGRKWGCIHTGHTCRHDVECDLTNTGKQWPYRGRPSRLTPDTCSKSETHTEAAMERGTAWTGISKSRRTERRELFHQPIKASNKYT